MGKPKKKAAKRGRGTPRAKSPVVYRGGPLTAEHIAAINRGEFPLTVEEVARRACRSCPRSAL